MNNKFIHALKWNATAIFFYKIMLLSHQIILYSAIPKSLYGLQNTLFALIYTLISLSNFGLDETILEFFAKTSKSKTQLRCIINEIFWHIRTTLLIAIISYIVMCYEPGEFLHNIMLYCNKNLIIIICLIYCIENLKKTAITIMQLIFLHEKVAYAQTIALSFYLITLWTAYYIYNQITIMTIFAPMLIASLLELIYYINNLMQFYQQQLPQEKTTSLVLFEDLNSQRIYNYINQVTKTAYSPNVITLYFAYMLNFQQTAIIKLYINIITLTYTCIGKTIGVTTGPIFATINQKQDLSTFFNYITNRYSKFLYLTTTVIIFITSYAYAMSYIPLHVISQLLLFFTIHLVENLSVTYEQLYIAKSKAWILTIIHVTTLLILLLSSIYFPITHYPYLSITIFLCIKIISLVTIRKITIQHIL